MTIILKLWIFTHWTVFSEESRWRVSPIERGTEVATAITTIASKTIGGAIAIAQATKATKTIAKATIVVAVVVAHCVRAWGFGWMSKVTLLRMDITSCIRLLSSFIVGVVPSMDILHSCLFSQLCKTAQLYLCLLIFKVLVLTDAWFNLHICFICTSCSWSLLIKGNYYQVFKAYDCA